MGFSALIYTREEALKMPPASRPMNYRVPSKIYHDVFEAVGAASTCREPESGNSIFRAEKACKVATDLLFKIATELERAGLVYENWPEDWK